MTHTIQEEHLYADVQEELEQEAWEELKKELLALHSDVS